MAYNWSMGHNAQSPQWTPKTIVIALVVYAVLTSISNSIPAPNKTFEHLSSKVERPAATHMIPSMVPTASGPAATVVQPSLPAIDHAIRPASDLEDRLNKARQVIAERQKKQAQNDSTLDAARPSFENASPAAPSVSEPVAKPREHKPRAKKSSEWALFFLKYGVAVLFIWWRLRHVLPDIGPPLRKLWDLLKKQAASTPSGPKTAASMPKSRPNTVSGGGFWGSRPASQSGGVVSRR